MDPSSTGTIQRIQSEKNILDEPDSPLEWIQAVLLFFSSLTVSGHIRYSIPEEMNKDSLIGHIAQDLGLDLKRLRSGRARIVTGESVQYTELKVDKGTLVVSERIDREQLCGEVASCSFSFEVILENPMELHPVTIEVLDVNDHSPVFKKTHIMLEISESANLGARFVLDSAEDPDVGVNGLQNYILTPNENFVLKQHVSPEGSKYAEMVLQKQLDREVAPRLSLRLMALDGGNPQRSGTATVTENAAAGTHVVTVNATDADSGTNGHITYSVSNAKSNIAELLSIDPHSGVLSVAGDIDFEKDKKYEIRIDAKDQGGLTDSSKVIIDVVDVNDNAPVINVMSFTSPVSEDSPPGTTVAQDGGSPPLSSNVTVKIRIQDQNDNPPQILYPVQTGSSMVAEMVPRSADVGYL
ncbi:hypothetical protein CCH79_00020960, partial [Gambusia affinis]